MPGMSPTGLEVATLVELRAQMSTLLQGFFGASIDVSDWSVEGQVMGILAERLADIWELIELVYSSQDPDKATGAALEALCLLTGTFRTPATPSSVTLTLTGTPTTPVPSGTLASTASTEQQFATSDDATIAALVAWANTTAYTVGDRRTNSSRTYVVITSGTSAGSGGPTTTAADITDGTVHWRYMGDGTGAVDVEAEATITGPVVAVSGDITVKDTPVGGWDGVINLTDADPGEDEMTDAELRVTRELELAQPGTSTQSAIRAAMLQLSGVISAHVFVNNSDLTDGDGMPPHSVEALVRGGEDQDIWNALLKNVAAGIQTHGTESGFSTDDDNTEQVMKFSRPDEIETYVRMSVVKDPDLYPADGDDQIELNIIEWADDLDNGRDVVPSALIARAFQIDGVLEVNDVRVYTDVIAVGAAWVALTPYSATVGARSVVTNDGGRAYICITAGTSAASGGPTGVGTDITDGTAHWRYLGANIVITNRQRPVYDTSRIDITSTDGTP